MCPQRTRTPVLEDEETDAAILAPLTDSHHQRPWASEEVEREIGDETATADSLARLAGVGLIHRLDRYVWATRPALHFDLLPA